VRRCAAVSAAASVSLFVTAGWDPRTTRKRRLFEVDESYFAAMVVTDLNGDGKPDIAIYGDGKDLEVIYNQGTNGWSEPKRWHIEDGQLSANALAEGDLTGDGRVVALDAKVHEKVKDVGEGIKVGAVADPFGNIFGIIENPLFKIQDAR